jgi:hypothetical protein
MSTWTGEWDEVRDAVDFADLRCRAIVELAVVVADVCHPRHHAAIRVLRERDDASASDRAALADIVAPALTMPHRQTLPTRFRSRSDRLLRNVGHFFPDEAARYWVREFLNSPLRARRLAATNLLRRISVSSAEREPLLQAVKTRVDREALELLCRLPQGLHAVSCCTLIAFADGSERHGDTYLASLILARLWQDDELDHRHAADHHRIPYFRAMGRIADGQQQDRLIAICEAECDAEVMVMAASVAGRLRNREAVQALRGHLR